MEMNWVIIWQSASELESVEVSDLLNHLGIPAQIHNQKDSAYVFLGEVKVLVPEHYKSQAFNLLVVNGYIFDRAFWN